MFAGMPSEEERHNPVPPTDEEWAKLTGAFDAGDLDRVVELLNDRRSSRAAENAARIEALRSIESLRDV